MDNIQYCFSFNEEHFTGSFGSIDEAISEAADWNCGEHETVYVGQTAHRTSEMKAEKIGDYLLDWIAESYISDYDQDGMYEYTNEQAKELGQMILSWMERNIDFNSFAVINVKEYPCPNEGDD